MRMHFPTQLQMLYFSQMAIRIEYSPKLLQHTKLKLKCHQFHRMHRNCLAFEVQYLKFCTEMYIISLHRISMFGWSWKLRQRSEMQNDCICAWMVSSKKEISLVPDQKKRTRWAAVWCVCVFRLVTFNRTNSKQHYYKSEKNKRYT